MRGVDVDHLESILSDGVKCVRRARWRYDDITSRRLDGSSAELEACASFQNHERLRVWMSVQGRSLSIAHVQDEERDFGTVGGTLESARPTHSTLHQSGARSIARSGQRRSGKAMGRYARYFV